MLLHTMDKTKLIMVMAMQRSGTTALFQTLSTAPTLVSYEESPDSAIYFDYFLRPEAEIRGALRSSNSGVLLKPVRETERRTLVSIIDEYKEYNVHILWMYRDPVNVIYSYGEQGWLDANTVGMVALEWVARNRMVAELPQRYRDKVTLLRYEVLVRDSSVLKALNRKLEVLACSTFRHDSNAGRARMPLDTQAQIDAVTAATLLDLDSLQASWRETLPEAKWKLSFAKIAARLSRQVPVTSIPSRLGEVPESIGLSTAIDFESDRFQREPLDCLRRWRECRRYHYAVSGNVWSLSGYDEVSDALKDTERFAYRAGRLRTDSPGPEEEPLRDAIAGAAIPGRDETMVSRLESLAREVITRQTAEGHFDLVIVCRVAIASMFYQILGVNSDDTDGFFERTIRGDSIESLSRGFSRGGWLARVATQTSLSSGALQWLLQFGSYFHYVTAIFANSAVHFLLGEPGLLEEIRGAPDRFPSTYTELVRLAYPLLVVERWTKVEVKVAGRLIPAHDLIYLAIGVSNRDPAAFERPDEFVSGRDLTTTKKPLTGYTDASFVCSQWEELGHLACRSLLKVLLTTFPIIEPVIPLGESKFTVTLSSGDFRKVLHIPFIRYLEQFNVKFRKTMQPRRMR